MTLPLVDYCRTVVAMGVGTVAVLFLSGCSSTVALEPAVDANNPLCAAVTVRLPTKIGGEERRYTDTQATGAWGTPAKIILTCGTEPLGPSDLPCYTLGGVDWLTLPQEAEMQRAVTFGRDPAVEVVVNRGANLDFAMVLDELGRQIAKGIPDPVAECSTKSGVPLS